MSAIAISGGSDEGDDSAGEDGGDETPDETDEGDEGDEGEDGEDGGEDGGDTETAGLTLTGTEGDDLLEGGAEGDTIVGGEGGSDTLIGNDGNDVLIANDETLGAPDTLIGGAGIDALWGDDGDQLTGGANADLFVIPVGVEGADPVTITDLDFTRFTDQDVPDRVVFVTPEIEIIPRSEFFDGTYQAGIGDLPDGSGAQVIINNQVVAIIEGYTADELFYETVWVGNFSPALTGFYDGDDALTGSADADEIFGGDGMDTILGLGGGDYLAGQQGDDFVSGVDAEGTEAVGDTVVGNAGDDTLRGDEADQLAGGEGNDSFELVVPDADAEDFAPMRLHSYEVDGNDGAHELITLIDADGTAISAVEAATNLTITDAEDGSGAALVYNGQVLAIVEGVDAEALGSPSGWLGNLGDVTPVVTQVSTLNATEVEVTAATGSGYVISESFFGGNLVYSINTDDGVPLDNFVNALEELNITHLRFPAGQGDSGDEYEDGDKFLNVLEMNRGADGDWELRAEVTDMLDWARENGAQVTLVLPTKNYTIAEYEALDDEIARFAQAVMEDYGDVVEAFEIGNEYWSSTGETEYGSKANVAAIALEDGMEAAGVDVDDQPSIIVQMATPNAGSDFHASVDDRSYTDRVHLANETIIAQLSAEARAAIDGVVEHYYYKDRSLEFSGKSGEVSFIDHDLAIWEEAFDKDLDFHVTEWNVKTTDDEETGLRSASVMVEQVQNLTELGADSAHVWPVQHNTPTDLAGSQTEEVVTDAQGRVISSINGATFDLMASSLVGLELIETDLSVEEGPFELDAYQSEDRTVVYVSSRSLESQTLELDLSELVPDFNSASAVRIGADFSASSSDGAHYVPGEGFQEAEWVLVNGERYYINENDIRASLTDLNVADTTVEVTLRPFEVIEITFDTAGLDVTPAPDPDPGTDPDPDPDPGTDPEGGDEGNPGTDPGDGGEDPDPEAGDVITGTAGADDLDGGALDDTLSGLAGDDHLTGGRGNDRVLGDAGDDSLYGWGGDDYLKGGDGDDILAGNEGDDTLIGSGGEDELRGGDGADELNGQTGDDTLSGGAGADTLTGWSGKDRFVMAEGDLADGDVITDFEPGKDRLEIDLPGIDSLDDVTFATRADGLVVTFGDHGSVLLQGGLTLEAVAQSRNFVFS
ncbi:type I secretion protein [Maritimibacter alkaliphilus]|uniref:calcium-binding protein n=1 Tax=Maritimibacter alkaliphilus TaxID=404236 RepID=UPI001C963C16|nr:type I secretion protein [Maritimibacter alkaliphilus]MBY6089327.1 type I secretion protein [Maritimibacter alkaliphilus]